MSIKSTNKVELAKRYASALFQGAVQNESVQETADELAAFSKLAQESKELQTVLSSQIISRKNRTEVILAVADKAGLSVLVHNFLGVLAQNGRLYAFEAIAGAYNRLYEEYQGILPVSVVAAQKLDNNLSQRLADVLGRIFEKQIRLDVSVDPRLIGGMTVKVGSYMVDSSIKSKLQKLNLVMKGAGS